VGSTSFSPVASVDFGSDAVRLQLWGSQGKNPGGTTRSNTSLDVSFDNLVIEADDITGLVPEPSTLTLATFGCLWMLVFSRRRHADR